MHFVQDTMTAKQDSSALHAKNMFAKFIVQKTLLQSVQIAVHKINFFSIYFSLLIIDSI